MQLIRHGVLIIPIVREGRTFDLYIDVVVNTVNDEYYYFVREGYSQSTEMSYITMGEVIQPHSHTMTWAGLHRGPMQGERSATCMLPIPPMQHSGSRIRSTWLEATFQKATPTMPPMGD